MKLWTFAIALVCFALRLDAQNEKIQSFNPNLVNLAQEKAIRYSTSEKGKLRNEEHTWLEIDLGINSTVKNIKIFPEKQENAKINNYLVVISNHTFEMCGGHKSNKEGCSVMNINAQLEPNEDFIGSSVLPCTEGRYVRIEVEKEISLKSFRIEVIGYQEIAQNGIDDDGDGFIDCDDPDFALPHFTPGLRYATCATCEDGMIEINVAGHDKLLSYSIDGGKTYQRNNYFEKIKVGEYALFLKNEYGCSAGYKEQVTLPSQVLQTEQNRNSNQLLGPITCTNGDFANNFQWWNGGLGNIPKAHSGTTSFIFDFQNNTFDIPSRHEILNSVVDSYTGLTMSSAFGNIARLGNDRDGGETERLWHPFVPTVGNTTLNFQYAVVLEDPLDGFDTHLAGEKPYFICRVKDASGAILWEKQIIADSNNPLFKVIPGTNSDPINYTDWLTECVDFSESINKELIIEFITGDCSQSGHFGYAYIKGICLNNTAINPVPTIFTQNHFCGIAKPWFDGSPSTGETKFAWTITKKAQGQVLGGIVIHEDPDPIDGYAGIFDFEEENIELECGFDYTAKLKLWSGECGYSETEATFTYSCPPKAEYKTMVICHGVTTPPNICMPVNNCIGCKFFWSPASDVDDPTIATPKFKNLSVGKHTLTVDIVADLDNGLCYFSKEVVIFVLPDITMKTEDIVSCHRVPGIKGIPACVPHACDYRVWASGYFAKFGIFLHYEDYWKRNGVIIPDGVGNFNGQLGTQVGNPKNIGGKYTYTVELDPNRYCIVGGCQKTEKSMDIIPDNYFFGSFPNPDPNCKSTPGPCMFVPNIIGSNCANDPANRRLTFFAPTIGYKAFFYKLEVFDRWGNMVVQKQGFIGGAGKEAFSPFAPESIFWDGFFNRKGKCVSQQGVYVWVLTLVNCNTTTVFRGDVTQQCNDTAVTCD